MPIIEYTPQVNAQPVGTVEQPSGLYTAGGKSFSEAAQQMDEVVKGFEKVRNAQQRTKATTDLQIELAQIEAEADNDANPDNLPTYQQRIDDAIGKHSQSISNPLLKDEFYQTAKVKGYSTYSSIGSTFRKRQIETAQNDLIKALDVSRETIIKTAVPEKREELYQSAMALLDQNVAAGVLTGDDAAKMRQKYEKEISLSEAYYDAHTNPDLANARLRAGEYRFIDTAEERSKVETFIKQAKQYQGKKARLDMQYMNNSAVNNAWVAIAEGKTDPGQIRAEFGDSPEGDWLLSKFNEEDPATSDLVVYGQYLDMTYNIGKAIEGGGEIGKASEAAFRIKKQIADDGRLTKSEKKKLLFGKLPGFDVTLQEVQAGDVAQQNTIPWFEKWPVFKNMFHSKTDAVKAYNTFLDNVSNDDTPATIEPKALYAMIETSLKKAGITLGNDWTMVTDAYGNVQKVKKTANGYEMQPVQSPKGTRADDTFDGAEEELVDSEEDRSTE